MKKKYFLAFLFILGSLSSFAQLGTMKFNTSTDNANNYITPIWLTNNNLGTGFSTWTLNSTGGGHYIGATGESGTSFGLYSDGSGNFASAERNLVSDLKMGETFSANVGHTSTVNGEVFLQLLDDGVAVFTVKFVGGTSGWQINDGGTDFAIGQNYAANTSLNFSFTYNEDGTYSYVFGSASGNNFTAMNNISGINGIKFQSTNQGGSQNFGFNNLSIDSKYTITGNSTLASDATITIPYLDIKTGSTLNIGTTSGITITGDLNVDGNLNVSAGSSLIVEGLSAGNISYNVNVADTNWHLISSPVAGQVYNDTWANNNAIADGNGTNRGISTYQNGVSDVTTGPWVYMLDGESSTFDSGIGYSLKRTNIGTYTFTGTFPNGTITPAISTNTTDWNLIGNPYPSNLDIATFITENATTNDFIADGFDAVYVWNGTDYTELTTGSIQPGQAFFIKSKVNGTASITEAMQSHTTGTFYKSAATSINLLLSNGISTKKTKINYLEGKTNGLDAGFDIGMFNGVASDLRVYTHLLENNQGIAFARQALPNTSLETLVIPVGVKAAANTEITISAETLNLPTGIKVFLEDKEANTFTRLDEDNSEYKVTLTDVINGVGRFYLYTTQSVLSVKDVILNGVSIFKSNSSTIRITGLPQGKATVSLFNVLGKQVMTTSFETKTIKDISLPKLASGVYFTKVQTETGKIDKKIILE
jgi:hypothetical protein